MRVDEQMEARRDDRRQAADRPSPATHLGRDDRRAAWLDKARRTSFTAALILDSDPESALVLAYDAGRQIGTGLLAQQGLRPTTAGGHVAVTRVVIDQFNGRFTGLDTLRRRRNELQYPSYPGDQVDYREAGAAIATVRGLLSDAAKLLPAIGFFTEQ